MYVCNVYIYIYNMVAPPQGPPFEGAMYQTWLQNLAPAACHGGMKGNQLRLQLLQSCPNLRRGLPSLWTIRSALTCCTPSWCWAMWSCIGGRRSSFLCFDTVLVEVLVVHVTCHGFPFPVGPSMPLGLIAVPPENEAGQTESVFPGSSGVVAWALWWMSLRLLFFVQNGHQRHAFIRARFQEHQVQSQIRILGMIYLLLPVVDQGNAGSARIDESLKFAQRWLGSFTSECSNQSVSH